MFDQWQDQQTRQNRSKHTLRVDNMKMLGSKNEQTAPHNTSINQNDKPPFDVQQTQQNTSNQIINEKEIPNFDAIPEDSNDWF